MQLCASANLARRGRSPLAPALSYGRHRGPAIRTARRAAVIVAIYSPSGQAIVDQVPDDATIVLTQRPGSLKHHGGQICLPGGKVEPAETTLEAALREFEEELGVQPNVRIDFGTLSSQYVYASANAVTPHVVWMDPPGESWRPDPAEVERVIEISVRDLIQKSASREIRRDVLEHRTVRNGDEACGELSFATPGFEFGPDLVWGATSMILHELAVELADELHLARELH